MNRQTKKQRTANKVLRKAGVPNPVHNKLHIKVLSGKNNIKVANLAGRVFVNVNTDHASSYTIDVSHWPSGIYLVRVIAENGTISSRKVIKE